MSSEIELKYAPPADLRAEKLFSDAGLAPYISSRRQYAMHTEYLDTRDGAAKTKGITLRRRFENGESVLYAKYGRKASGALTARGEWSVRSENVKEAAALLAEVGAPTETLCGRELCVCASVRFEREEALVSPYPGFSFLLSFDDGVFGGNTHFTEVELELVSGNTEELVLFGSSLAEKYSLIPETRSKYIRALEAEMYIAGRRMI